MNHTFDEIFDIGESFHGYTIERVLGRGGLGVVYLIKHNMLDTLYALKILNPKVAKENESCVKRFLREAKIASRIRHPNLVSVHDCGYDSDKNIYYIVMDYVEGGNLREALAFSGKFSCEEAAKIVMQVASALEAAQQYGVVHRDIKPENIMIQSNGVVKLVDLGIAKAIEIKDSLRTAAGIVFGTPVYVSPEQAISAADVDVRADIYSLGIVFFEMVCGQCPYKGKNTQEVLAKVMSDDPAPDVRDFNKEIPVQVATLIRRMCVKEYTRRISSPTILIKELEKTGLCKAPDSSPFVEYSKTEDSLQDSSIGLGISIDDLPKAVKDTLSLTIDDEEIKKVLLEMRKKRLRKKILIFLLPLIFSLVVVLLVIRFYFH